MLTLTMACCLFITAIFGRGTGRIQKLRQGAYRAFLTVIAPTTEATLPLRTIVVPTVKGHSARNHVHM